MSVFFSKRRLPVGRFTAVASAVLLLSGLLIVFSLLRGESRYWPGWYVMELPPDVNETRVLDEIKQAGLPEPVSALNSSVLYMDIPDLRRLSVADIDRVLPPGDPRRDAYISSVRQLFRSEGAELVYLPADRRIAAYRRVFQEFPNLKKVRILDELPGGGLKAVLLFVFGAVLVVLGAGSQRFQRAASALVWLPFVFFALPGSVLAALLVYMGSPVCFWLGSRNTRLWAKTLFMLGYGASLALLLLSACGMPLEWPLVLFVLAAAAGSEAASFLCYRFLPASPSSARRLFRKQEHNLFEPVSLIGFHSSWKTRKTRKTRQPAPFSTHGQGMLMPALAAAALLLLLPRGFVAGGKTAYEMRMRVLPVPGLPEGSFSSYKSLSRLFNSRESSELPNFSSLVASRAYQESLLFGGRYELPQPGNGISLTSYREDGARMEAVSSSILQFDNSWYMDVTEDETVSGTGRLLASRGGPAPVFRQSRAVGGLPALSRLWELISGFFIIISLLLSTGIPAKFNTSERIPNSFISSFRFRRRIEAA